MSINELSERLDQRLALLTEGSRSALPRHRTLRSMLDWSYNLLTDDERAMLGRVAVFAGGWTLASAEKACTGDPIASKDVIDLLASLADKNLIIADEEERATRYRMLETLRQYGQDRLREGGEEPQWRNRHLASFLGLVEAAFPGLRGPAPELWLDRIAVEHDNLRAALSWSVAARSEQGLQLAAMLFRYWLIRGHLTEGRGWYSRLLEVLPSDLAIGERARALNSAGILARVQGDHAEAKRLHEESLAIARVLNEPRRIAAPLDNLASIAMEHARYEDAEAMLQEAATLERAIGDRLALASTLANLGILLRIRGDYPAARLVLNESLITVREVGERFGEAVTLRSLGMVECADGNLKAAEQHLAESLAICGKLSDRVNTAAAIEGLAHVAVAIDTPRRAARMWGAAERLREEVGSRLPVYEHAAHAKVLEAARAAVGQEEFNKAWQEGRAMTLEDAVRYTLDMQAGRNG
jgi:non-specific serine/threonine protein kinase